MPELRDEELDALLERAVLTHLTDEELGLYHDGAADEVAQTLAAAHLKRCLICTKRFDTMKHILATYHEVEVPPESVERLKALIAAARPKQEQAATLVGLLVGLALYARDRQGQRRKVPLRLGGAHAAGEEVYKGEFDGETLTWRVEKDEHDDLAVLFTSDRLEWKDYRLNIQIGPHRHTAVLKPVDERLLGAGFVITRAERALLGEGDEMRIESVSPPQS